MIFSTGGPSEFDGRQRRTPFNHYLVTLNWLNDGVADESGDAVTPRALDREGIYETVRPLVRLVRHDGMAVRDRMAAAKLAYWKRTPNLWRP